METTFTNRYGNELYRYGGYIFLAPHPLLRPFVAHYTILRTQPSAPESITIIPDASGCFVFEPGAQGLSCLVFGASTKTTLVDGDAGAENLLLFAEFSPGGLAHFTRESQTALSDRVLPLNEVSHPLQALAQSAFRQANGDLDAFFQLLDAILLTSALGREPPPALLESVALLRDAGGALTVKALSAHTYYSERHLNRLFSEHLGLGVKQFARLLRVNHAIQVMKSSDRALTATALDTGYFDQSHFIRDFKSICGVTPREYLFNLSDFYNEPIKL